MIRNFGLFYLSGCGVLFITATFAGTYQSLIFVTAGLFFNIYLYIWCRRYLPSIGNSLSSVVSQTGFGAVYEKYGISVRQREIIELMLHGKSNRDIAEKLFIAQHTVKNHIYNLYQKLGVKSRFELIDFFLKAARK
jgi:DNA-binding CsgD family transcriptional regulator